MRVRVRELALVPRPVLEQALGLALEPALGPGQVRVQGPEPEQARRRAKGQEPVKARAE